MTAGEQKQIKDAINIMILCGMTFKENTDIESDLIKYAKLLKDKSKHKQIIVVSNQKEIIDVADKLIEL